MRHFLFLLPVYLVQSSTCSIDTTTIFTSSADEIYSINLTNAHNDIFNAYSGETFAPLLIFQFDTVPPNSVITHQYLLSSSHSGESLITEHIHLNECTISNIIISRPPNVEYDVEMSESLVLTTYEISST
jgi:hypothetical protein